MVDETVVPLPPKNASETPPKDNLGRQGVAPRNYVTDGVIEQIPPIEAPLETVLSTVLTPLGLAYTVEPGFVWVSTPELIQAEAVPEPPERYAAYDMAGALNQIVKIQFDNVHMQEVFNFIMDAYEGVGIVLDTRVIEPRRKRRAPYTEPSLPTHPANDGIVRYVDLKDVEIRDALKAMVWPLDLTFSIEEGFIFISTPERIQKRLFTYPGTTPWKEESNRIEFEDTHLDTILASLGKHGKPPLDAVLVDNSVVAPPGAEDPARYPCDGHVTAVRLTRLPLRVTLNALLRPRGLDYAVTGNTLWVSSPQRISAGRFDLHEYRAVSETPAAAKPGPQSEAPAASTEAAPKPDAIFIKDQFASTSGAPVLKRIEQLSDGSLRAQIMTVGGTHWYGEGESFEAYTLRKIDPQDNTCEINNDHTGEVMTLPLS